MKKDGIVKKKKYNYKGELVFEGEYLNRKRNGKGKEYILYNKSLLLLIELNLSLSRKK